MPDLQASRSIVTDENISDLSLLENNPRNITKDELEKLCLSLQDDPDFLTKRPVLVNKKGEKLIVYAGNQRVLAAKWLGWTKIPCIIDEELSDDITSKRAIRDNRHNGLWDFDMLANSWDLDLLIECGFTEKEFDPELKNETNKKDKKLKKCPHCGEIINGKT